MENDGLKSEGENDSPLERGGILTVVSPETKKLPYLKTPLQKTTGSGWGKLEREMGKNQKVGGGGTSRLRRRRTSLGRDRILTENTRGSGVKILQKRVVSSDRRGVCWGPDRDARTHTRRESGGESSCTLAYLGGRGRQNIPKASERATLCDCKRIDPVTQSVDIRQKQGRPTRAKTSPQST